MGKAHDRLCSVNAWTITEVDSVGGMRSFVTVGARFRVMRFDDGDYIAFLEGFHPSMPRSVLLKRDTWDPSSTNHPPHKQGMPDPDSSIYSFPVGHREFWLVVTFEKRGDIATIGFPAATKNHGGAHGRD